MPEPKKVRRDAALSYPFENKPAPGELVPIVEGINWLRMPLPFSLNHINLWAIEGDSDWSIVDTGLASDETVELWQAVHTKYGSNKPFKNVFITHMHPDHIGQAGYYVIVKRPKKCQKAKYYFQAQKVISLLQ